MRKRYVTNFKNKHKFKDIIGFKHEYSTYKEKHEYAKTTVTTYVSKQIKQYLTIPCFLLFQ